MTGQPGNVPDSDAINRADRDPWDVESSWYERRKLIGHTDEDFLLDVYEATA